MGILRAHTCTIGCIAILGGMLAVCVCVRMHIWVRMCVPVIRQLRVMKTKKTEGNNNLWWVRDDGITWIMHVYRLILLCIQSSVSAIIIWRPTFLTGWNHTFSQHKIKLISQSIIWLAINTSVSSHFRNLHRSDQFSPVAASAAT